MPLEIEAKFRVETHEPVRERLCSLGATPLGKVLELNRILDRPDGALRSAGRGLRVRVSTPEDGSPPHATLTLKGPRRPGPLKSREELEVGVSDADTLCEVLSLLGFLPILRYQKRRESWSYRDCCIELDEPPHIGRFVEIEGPNEATIRGVQAELGLDDASLEPKSYVHLLADYCAAHGIADRVLDFPIDGATSP